MGSSPTFKPDTPMLPRSFQDVKSILRDSVNAIHERKIRSLTFAAFANSAAKRKAARQSHSSAIRQRHHRNDAVHLSSKAKAPGRNNASRNSTIAPQALQGPSRRFNPLCDTKYGREDDGRSRSHIALPRGMAARRIVTQLPLHTRIGVWSQFSVTTQSLRATPPLHRCRSTNEGEFVLRLPVATGISA